MIKMMMEIKNKHNLYKLKHNKLIDFQKLYGNEITGYFVNNMDNSLILFGIILDYRIYFLKAELKYYGIMGYDAREL